MPAAARVLIVERLIIRGQKRAVPTLLSDTNMLVLTGAQEHTSSAVCSGANITAA
jgi:hypothetical protein